MRFPAPGHAGAGFNAETLALGGPQRAALHTNRRSDVREALVHGGKATGGLGDGGEVRVRGAWGNLGPYRDAVLYGHLPSLFSKSTYIDLATSGARPAKRILTTKAVVLPF